MNRICKILCALLSAALLSAGAQAEYIGSTPDSGVYVVQSQAHTCTLIATTMMLRNYAYQNDSFYDQVTESAVRSCAWNSKGLKWDFTLGSVNVQVNHDIRDAKDKKAYLIEILKVCREGVVIYDANAPHAVWLFGYDADTDTFYCADTTTDVAGRMITLQESILKGKTQEEKINSIDRIWHISRNAEI